MKKIEIDMSEGNMGPCCVGLNSDKPQKYYPSVTYTSDTEMELPDSGRMIIEFKKVESRESNRDGKEQYSCTFEVRKIVGVEGSEDENEDSVNAGKSKNEAEDALDKLRDEYVGKRKKG